ncbi:MAG: hypothetical protein KC454_11790 [Flavobacteriales bacterium]|nr:hypothetical protein [Flavobacteriales bacterium]
MKTYIIENPGNYSKKRLWLTSIAIGFLSHWLSWYLSYLAYYVYIVFTDWTQLEDAINPLVAIYSSCLTSLLSILFFGWLAFPLSIGTLFYLSDSKTK